jgi:hypothetical protein
VGVWGGEKKIKTYAPKTHGVAIFIEGLKIATEVFASYLTCVSLSSGLDFIETAVHATIPPREGLNFPPRPRGGMMSNWNWE